MAALVLAALMPSALCAEPTEKAHPTSERLPALLDMKQPSVGDAVRGLERLRLRPGRDGLDVSETARRRPLRARD